MQIDGFDWDSGNWPKCAKHGLSKDEIEFSFLSCPSVYPDIKHSKEEKRFLSIGKTDKNRYILVAFTFRLKDGDLRLIRPISARYMHKKEVEHYEKQQGIA